MLLCVSEDPVVGRSASDIGVEGGLAGAVVVEAQSQVGSREPDVGPDTYVEELHRLVPDSGGLVDRADRVDSLLLDGRQSRVSSAATELREAPRVAVARERLVEQVVALHAGPVSEMLGHMSPGAGVVVGNTDAVGGLGVVVEGVEGVFDGLVEEIVAGEAR